MSADALAIKHKIIEEIDLLPEELLPELYRLIHYFRLGVMAYQNLQNRSEASLHLQKSEPNSDLSTLET